MTKTVKNIEDLNVNITAIVIGALAAIVILAWINLIRTYCEHTLEDDREDRYQECWRKFVSALVTTLLSVIVIAGIIQYHFI